MTGGQGRQGLEFEVFNPEPELASSSARLDRTHLVAHGTSVQGLDFRVWSWVYPYRVLASGF